MVSLPLPSSEVLLLVAIMQLAKKLQRRGNGAIRANKNMTHAQQASHCYISEVQYKVYFEENNMLYVVVVAVGIILLDTKYIYYAVCFLNRSLQRG